MESILNLVLPGELLEYFELEYYCEFCELSTREASLIIHLQEKNIVPKEYDASDYEAKDFLKPVVVQDFPLRGKSVYYSMRKRRWRKKPNHKNIIQRDFNFLTSGTRLTSELVSFFKDTDRDPSRYDKEYL